MRFCDKNFVHGGPGSGSEALHCFSKFMLISEMLQIHKNLNIGDFNIKLSFNMKLLRLVWTHITCMKVPLRVFVIQFFRGFYSRSLPSADRESQQLPARLTACVNQWIRKNFLQILLIIN
jgi:hypothetical protein